MPPVSIPALVKVLSCFLLILVLNRLRLHLSLCLFIGALALGLWMRLPAVAIAASFLSGISSAQTLQLVAIICLILMLSQMLKSSGQLERMVGKFVAIVHDLRTASAVMPALIGLLPMPGGALFSAPMVETAMSGCCLSGDSKTAVNYWFRHVWEYWWPLYPGVVLAVGLLQVETWRFIAIQLPLTGLSVAAGAFFLLRPLHKMEQTPAPGGRRRPRRVGPFLWEAMPIALVVGSIVLFSLVRHLLGWLGAGIELPPVLPLLLGLVACVIWVMRVNRLGFRSLGKALIHRGTLSMLLLIVGIMVFKGILVDSRAVFQIRAEMVSYHIPLLVVVVAMPFISGLITGIAIGFVGASFPLVVPLFSGGSQVDFLAHASLAYAAGYMGMMLSPVHICLLVTRDYFKASLADTYRRLYKPAAAVMAVWGAVMGLVLFL